MNYDALKLYKNNNGFADEDRKNVAMLVGVLKDTDLLSNDQFMKVSIKITT